MEVRKGGITVVEVGGKEDLMFLSIAFVNAMRNMPELEQLVLLLMANKITPDDLGITTNVSHIPKGVDAEKHLRKLQGQAPAKVDDVPDFVKRSLDKLKDEK